MITLAGILGVVVATRAASADLPKPAVPTPPATSSARAAAPAPPLTRTVAAAAPAPAPLLTEEDRRFLAKYAPPDTRLFSAVTAHAPRVELLRATAADARGRLDAFASSRYGAAGAPALGTLRGMNPDFEQLVVDPGIVTRLGRFRSFIEKNPAMRGADPWAARQAFSASLGTATVYRALALTPDEYAKAKHDGLASRFVRMPERGADGVVSQPLRDQVNQRVSGWSGLSEPLVSVASRAHVATGVAATVGRAVAQAAPGKEVYLFRAKVPKLDVLTRHDGDRVLPTEARHEGTTLRTTWTDRAGKEHTSQYPFASPKVESFMMYEIDPSEIVSSKKVAPAQAGSYEIVKPSAPTKP